MELFTDHGIPYQYTSGDFNGDGINDIVISSQDSDYNSHTIQVPCGLCIALRINNLLQIQLFLPQILRQL